MISVPLNAAYIAYTPYAFNPVMLLMSGAFHLGV